MHPSQDTSPFCSEIEFAKYEKDTGLLGDKYYGAPSSNVPLWLTPVAIFALAVAVVISAMPAAAVQYLVFAIMFSAPAVGVWLPSSLRALMHRITATSTGLLWYKRPNASWSVVVKSP
jgi:hypothetical protein